MPPLAQLAKKYQAVLFALAAVALTQVPTDRLDTVVAVATKLAGIYATVRAATTTAPKDHEEPGA